MSRYVCAYDIADTRARRRVSRLLAQFGERTQRSVHEVWLDDDDIDALMPRVGALLSRDDRFDIIPIDTHPDRRRLTWQRTTMPGAPVIVLR